METYSSSRRVAWRYARRRVGTFVCLSVGLSALASQGSVRLTVRRKLAGRTRLVDIVPRCSRQIPPLPDPMLLHLHLPPALQHRIPCQLAHVRGCEFVDLRGARVFLEEMRGGKVELQRVVCESKSH